MKTVLAENREIASHGLDLWGAAIENKWLKDRRLTKHFSEFKDKGVFVFPIGQDVANSLLRFFDPACKIDFGIKDVGENFFGSELSKETVDRLK